MEEDLDPGNQIVVANRAQHRSSSPNNGGNPTNNNPGFVYAPQTHQYFFTGYEPVLGRRWSDRQNQFFNVEPQGTLGMYGENSPFMLPNGYGYNGHMGYGSYPPGSYPPAPHYYPQIPLIRSPPPDAYSETTSISDQQVEGTVITTTATPPPPATTTPVTTTPTAAAVTHHRQDHNHNQRGHHLPSSSPHPMNPPRRTGGGFFNGSQVGEQSRGPRAARPRNSGEKNPNVGQYSGESLASEYPRARFFVIKSYSEDNVHKSIKYGVWSSTGNGNRKLDAVYREATAGASSKADAEKEAPSSEQTPVFFFFSVNGSGHFCGVAEMVGGVDFESSADYWIQDRWAGQFPVRWHVVKDVPNSQLRHIVLECNENRPVTNSRDTQEVVNLQQGHQILNIFKSYRADVSVLDDFTFYEEREKLIQIQKERRRLSTPPPRDGDGDDGNGDDGDRLADLSGSLSRMLRVDGAAVTATNDVPLPPPPEQLSPVAA